MEKKKKRASFSLEVEPPKPTTNDKVRQSDPGLKQVVEVIVEQQPGSKHTPQVNIVVPQPVETETKLDKDVAAVVDHLPNVIDDGTDDEVELTPRKQQMLTEVVASDDDQVSEEIDDQSVVTASATPTGDTVVVTEDLDEVEEYQLPVTPPATLDREQPRQVVSTPAEIANGDQTSEERTESSKVTPPMKIHTAETDTDTQEHKTRESAVAELFSNAAANSMPEITVHKQRQTKGILLWAITMIAIALGVGGGLVLFTTRSNESAQNPAPAIAQTSPTPSPTATIQQTPTPTMPALKRSEIRIQVLNGGGVAGAGSRMKNFLEEKGYRVVETKNADVYSYESTEIIVKSTKADALSLLSTDLKTEYEVGKTASNLPESSTYDVRVIVGKNE